MATLEEERAQRWWLTRPQVRTIKRAAGFIDDVGFAVLFPRAGVPLPCLWTVGSDRGVEDIREVVDSWGPDAARMWGWKDLLPERGLAWYGIFIRGKQSFLSPRLLADLYPRAGEPDDFLEAGLSADARRIAEVLLASGATSKAVLREAVGLEGKRFGAQFSRALAELGRALVVTHHGTEDEGPGWPSAVIELTARAFRVRSKTDPSERRLGAARTFIDTMVVAGPADLARAFNWPGPQARAVLDELARRGEADLEGKLYRFAAGGKRASGKPASGKPASGKRASGKPVSGARARSSC